MFRFILIATLVAIAAAAPQPLSLISALKTPASTAKLTHIETPLLAPITPLAYAAPAYSHIPAFAIPTHYIAGVPTSYSISQHGYHISY